MDLLALAKDRSIILLVQDEVLLNVVPTLTKMWSPKGKQPLRIPTEKLKANKKERVAVFGALNVLTGQVYRFIAPEITKKTFLRFLKRLRRHYAHLHPNIPICLVIDGHPSHRAHDVVHWAEHQPRFFLYRLPKNRPEINPIEYFWKLLREEVTHKRYHKTVRALKIAISRFFSNYWNKLPTLRAWILEVTQNIWTSDKVLIQVG